MAQNNAAIETETGSPIESGIGRTWGHYAFVDDGEYALVVGVSYASDDIENVRDVEYGVYVCEAGLVDTLENPATHQFGERPNNLADAAVQLLEQISEDDGRDPIKIARDYWA